MSDLRKAAKMLIETHDQGYGKIAHDLAVEELRKALAQPEQKKEWVGLDGEIPGLGLVTEEFYNGMLFAEDILREKNT